MEGCIGRDEVVGCMGGVWVWVCQEDDRLDVIGDAESDTNI